MKIRPIRVIRVRFLGELFIQLGAGSLSARQWRHEEGKGLGIGERGR